MRDELLQPSEVDNILRYPIGRSARLARRGEIPHVVLPDGSLRFEAEKIDLWLSDRSVADGRERPDA